MCCFFRSNRCCNSRCRCRRNNEGCGCRRNNERCECRRNDRDRDEDDFCRCVRRCIRRCRRRHCNS